MKAIALLSGGLDSTLAARLILDQGVDVHGLSFKTVFSPGAPSPDTPSPAQRAAERLGIPFHTMDHTQTMLDLLDQPPHGFGSNLNPCIDCHMAMIRKASTLMESVDASFIVTGEVLGQRPMSQNKRSLGVIDEGSGLPGLVLRPLSALALPPTIPEKQGWVDRDKLLDIEGRSRRRQIRLAEDLGISDYPAPAGGCLLTDPGFSRRLRDLLDHGAFSIDDVQLLKVGRHLRLDAVTKLVVGRYDADCLAMESLARPGDLLLTNVGITGPLGVLRGASASEHCERAAALVARYCRLRHEESVEISITPAEGGDEVIVAVTPASPEEAKPLLIG